MHNTYKTLAFLVYLAEEFHQLALAEQYELNLYLKQIDKEMNYIKYIHFRKRTDILK